MLHNPRNAEGKLNRFFEWSYHTRANTVKKLAEGQMLSPEKMYLSFTSHNPVCISNGSAGLNGSVKGIGYAPKQEYMEETLQKYVEHIKTYDPADKTYSHRGLKLLIDCLYSEEAEKNIDFNCVYSVEMAFHHTYQNLKNHSGAALLFYQPPTVSYELRGNMELFGKRHERDAPVRYLDLPVIQQFINAQHDVYHMPDTERWKTRPVYKFTIEEIWDKSNTEKGFGTRVEF